MSTEKLIPADEMGKYLTAFADGELGAAESLEVLEYLDANPDAFQRVIGQQRFRLAAERSVKASTPPVPESLRRRVASVAAPTFEAPNETSSWLRSRPDRARRWLLPLSAAACVAVGVSVGRFSSSPPPVTHAVRLSTPRVSEVMRVHVDCSRYADHFHQPAFPREAENMSAVLHEQLGTAAPFPDLSVMGYAFAGAGPCNLPGGNTVHLLYRPISAELTDTISVFLQADTGQVGVESDKAYLVSATDAPHPVLMWRSGGLLYYLVADAAGTAHAALAAIPTAPKMQKV